MAEFHVSVRINNDIKTECLVEFGKWKNLKCIHLDFENKQIHYYIKDLEIIENENAQVDVVQLKNNFIHSTDFINIRFDSSEEKEHFLETGFPDRTQDSSTSTTPSPPPNDDI